MFGTGSSAQSECSAYTSSSNINSEHLVNFQQRFKQFNPEAPYLMEKNTFQKPSLHSDTSHYDPNHNTVQCSESKAMQDIVVKNRKCATLYPDIRPYCSCNIHIHYNISYTTSEACQCKCGSKNHTVHPDLGQGSHRLHTVLGEEGSVCDV